MRFPTLAARLSAPVLATWGALALAADGVEADEEIVVFPDKFARWDGTRWFVRTQIGLPMPYVMYAERNAEIQPTAFDLSFVLACEKTWRRGKKRFEVDCGIEDIGLRVAVFYKKAEQTDPIVKAFDERLTGARLQLIVTDDGKVTNIDLEGLDEGNDREQAVSEQARLLLMRAISGFHMKLPRASSLKQGQWVEYESPMFSIPLIRQEEMDDGEVFKRFEVQTLNPMGGSFVINQLDAYRGHMVVQTKGKGTVAFDLDAGDDANFIKMTLDGVAIYDPDTGIMTERVWALKGKATGGSALGFGRVAAQYFHNGRIRKLGDDEQVDVGWSGRVGNPGAAPIRDVPAWAPLD